MTKHLTPNWFASVMGTGILATAAVSLPIRLTALRWFATGVWLLAAVLLAVLLAAFAAHWASRRDEAIAHARHQVIGQFYGALPMALLTVGTGAGQLAGPLVGQTAALWVSAVLWTAGTAAGLSTSLAVPYRMIVSPGQGNTSALPAWLMPVVPPMVSASTGAALVTHVAEGESRLSFLVVCYMMFGLSFFAGMLTIAMVYARLTHHGLMETQSVPTVWILLGMIGQSITAANLLGAQARLVFTGSQEPIATGLRVFGVGYGLVMGGFGALVFALAAALTLHAARRGLMFSLTWWSFTFPIGTCVTGSAALGATTGSDLFQALAAALYIVLVGAWATVARGTASHVAGLVRAEASGRPEPAPRFESPRPAVAAPHARLLDLAGTSSTARW